MNKKGTVTKKKVKVTGKKKFIDPDNGQMVEMVVTTVEDRDFNFTKVWLMNFLPVIDKISNKKLTVAMWIIDHLDRENKLCYTQEAIARLSGVGLSTVKETVKVLLDSNFLRKRSTGVYILNPDCLWKGGMNARMNALFQFNSTKGAPTSTSKRLQLESLEKNIAMLQNKANILRKSIKKDDLEDELSEEVSKRMSGS